MCRSILYITERTVRVEIGGDSEVEGGGIWQNLKKGVDNTGGLHKIGGLALLCQLFEETLKISHPPPL